MSLQSSGTCCLLASTVYGWSLPVTIAAKALLEKWANLTHYHRFDSRQTALGCLACACHQAQPAASLGNHYVRLLVCQTLVSRILDSPSIVYNSYAFLNLQMRPNFSHCTHRGKSGSHLIFFSRHVIHAIARRFRGLPALVTPQCAFTASPSMTVLQ